MNQRYGHRLDVRLRADAHASTAARLGPGPTTSLSACTKSCLAPPGLASRPPGATLLPAPSLVPAPYAEAAGRADRAGASDCIAFDLQQSTPPLRGLSLLWSCLRSQPQRPSAAADARPAVDAGFHGRYDASVDSASQGLQQHAVAAQSGMAGGPRHASLFGARRQRGWTRRTWMPCGTQASLFAQVVATQWTRAAAKQT